MSAACRQLHMELSTWPRFKAGFDENRLPKNGVYVLFENGEIGHGVDRIVRIGTHTGQNNLCKRLKEHLFASNKDRSIFRKHVGRCLLSRDGDSFLESWERDLTTRINREKYGHTIDKRRQDEVERAVTDYINRNFSFVVLSVDQKEKRLKVEAELLSTVSQCTECGASDHWLGALHPNRAIKDSGMWNVQGLNGTPCDEQGIRDILFG